MADGQVVFEIKGDAKDVNQTVKQVTNNIQSESKKWDQAVGNSTDKMGTSFLSMKTVAVTAVAAIGTAVINFGKQAIEAASDLAEVQNVVDTVFGDGARQIEAWAQKAGEQFGLTETQAKKFTSTLGAMMKSSGLAGKEIIEMSTDLAGLAADMASFYNMDFETAFEKIRSGISGETMPLKQLGINMSVANLEAFALAQGLEKTFQQMDQGEQTMLRYQYLMQATADAQGDFERTSDGFANAQRRISSALDTISTTIGSFLLKSVEPLVSGIADITSGLASSMTPDRTIFDDINDIEVDSASKLADIQATYDKAEDLIKILQDIEKETVTLQDGTTVSLDSIFSEIGDLEKNGGDIEGYITSLGLNVEDIIFKYNEWKEATRQLTSLVPGLTSVIDSETGSIDGGTEALQRNLDEWKKNEENKVYWAEYYAKAEAVARAKGEQAGIQIEAKARQLAADRAKQAMQAILLDDKKNGFNFADDASYIRAVDEYARLQDLADKASKEAEKTANDLIDMEALLADELSATEAITGETLASQSQNVKDAGEAVENYLGKTVDTWKKETSAVVEATKALREYYQSALDATAQSVNSTVKGFEKLGKAGDDLRKKQEELGEEAAKTEEKYSKIFDKWGTDDNSLKRMGDNWDKLSKEEQKAYNELAKIRNEQKEVNDALNQYTPSGMQSSLQSQIKFMEDYLKNLDQLKEWGVSDEMLASLSDGSKESAEFLAGLVEGGPEAAGAVGELYNEVQNRKNEFTKALTDQKLTVDETYQGILDTAMSTIENLNMSDEAEAAMAGTVEGIANGIALHVPEVASAVDSLLAELNRLSNLGIGFSFDSDGNLSFALDGSHEQGLSFVPFDGYLAELHQGEGILTAEENRIWQRFKNGQASHANVDYDALGGIMRDNIHAGGDVFLDGRTVGRVISDIQGNQYRSLQRSGWQS